MIAYLDCASTGISGDKFLGALISAGFDPDLLVTALRPLGLAEAVRFPERRSGGIAAVGVDVAGQPLRTRTFSGIRDVLHRADAPPEAIDSALRILDALNEAEASVHGVPLADVHFHELGTADTVVDVLGAALGMHALGIETLVVSPVAVGSGTAPSSHGELPVPAPATAVMLEGLPVVPGAASGELTTPTGAAIVRTLAAAFSAVPPMRIAAVGRGAGTRDLGIPNIIQLLVGEPLEPADTPDGAERVVTFETNIDHLPPEALAFACDRILESGALDVWQASIVMKKGRAAILLSALAAPEDAPHVAAAIIRETGSLGVRVVPAERFVAWRESLTIPTSLGPARFKVWRAGDHQGLRVEHEDAARAAREHGVPIMEAVRRLESEARASLAQDEG